MAELYIKQRGGPEVNILAPAGHTMSAGETVNSVHVSYPRVKTWVSVISFGTGILCLLLLFVPGTILESDGRSMFAVTESIVMHGDSVLRESASSIIAGVVGVDGKRYSKYGPGQSLVAVPFFLLGQAIEPSVPAIIRPEMPVLVSSLIPTLAIMLSAVLVALTAVELGASMRWGLLLALIYVVATPAAVYAGMWFSEPLTGVLLLFATYMVMVKRNDVQFIRPFLAGSALGLAVATRVDSLIFIPFLALYIGSTGRNKIARLWWLFFPLAIALIALGSYNMYRFGSPLQTGYGAGNYYDTRDLHAFTGIGSVLTGLYGLLISPGKGLLEYAPPVLLCPFGFLLLMRTRRAEALLFAAFIVVCTVAHADILIRWVAGWSWGPRFLVPILPFAILLLAPLPDVRTDSARFLRWLLIILCLLGIFVQVPALLVHEPHTYFYTTEAQQCPGGNSSRCTVADINRIENNYITIPSLSPILGGWSMLGKPSTWRPPSGVTAAVEESRSVTVAPRTWWRLLSLQGIGTVALSICVFILFTIGLLLLITSVVVAPPRRAELIRGP